MKKIIIRFGMLAVAVFILLQLSTYSLIRYQQREELTIVVIAIIFIGLGIYLSRFFIKKESEATPENGIDEKAISKLGISDREYEVLTQMASGKSNLEIAESLFISESTVKTHVSNLLIKLDARRRTEAIKIALSKKLIRQ